MPNLVPDPLLDYRVVTVDGPDSLRFLQSQLCNDVNALGHLSSAQGAQTLPETPQAQPSGYCNAKGRLYANFWTWSDQPDRFHLLVSASLASVLVKRLSMFVLRAKVKIRETDRAIWGGELAEPIDLSFLAAQGLTLLPADLPSGPRASNAPKRFWLIGPEVSGEAPEQTLLPHQMPAGFAAFSSHAWQEAEMRQGLPWFQAELSERFVPQTINLDLLGGVSFTKGCYPGQEVVARSHYLGKLNQRMFLFDGPAGLRPGGDVFLVSSASEAMEPIGEVVSAASAPDSNRALYLVSLKLEPFRGQSFVMGLRPASQEPVRLELQPLAYDVPREPQVPNRPKL